MRYCVEQQAIAETGRAFQPTEEDWQPNGQDGVVEQRLGAKLVARFAEGPRS